MSIYIYIVTIILIILQTFMEVRLLERLVTILAIFKYFCNYNLNINIYVYVYL